MASNFPNSKDTFTPFMDVTSSDATLLKNYQTAKQNGNESLANQYLSQISDYDKKVLTAEKFNLQNDALNNMEQFYGTDIKPYINVKQQEWKSIIDQFSYISRYNSTVVYKKNNMVLYNDGVNDLIYICTTTPPTNGYAPSNTTYWRTLTIKGQKGSSSSVAYTVFMGDWVANENYTTNMIVIYENGWWYSKSDNLNQTPQLGSEYWDYIMPMVQNLYSIQSTEPTDLNVGGLWFEVIE